MTAEGAVEFEALEAQAASLMARFVNAGYERVAPAFIQPAGLFFDRIGEAIRSRTYVFTDPSGEELCLRPELTIPVARIFLERGAAAPAKFCYNGPAFRIQEGVPDPLRPREFRQAGVEYFGSLGSQADLEIIALTLDAVRSAGMQNFTLRIGHIGLFGAVLAALDMPQRWRDRLARAFWRPAAFARELKALSKTPDTGTEAASGIRITDTAGFFAALDARGVPFFGTRSPEEIVLRLRNKDADRCEAPLSNNVSALLQEYLHLSIDGASAAATLHRLFSAAGLDIRNAIDDLDALLASIAPLMRGNPIRFSADFGRHLEYYTGVVFQIETSMGGVAGQLAGGGRYDGLIAALSGGTHAVSAVGAAFHTERLLAAVTMQGRSTM